jgi:hypothetical protein
VGALIVSQSDASNAHPVDCGTVQAGDVVGGGRTDGRGGAKVSGYALERNNVRVPGDKSRTESTCRNSGSQINSIGKRAVVSAEVRHACY